MKEHSILRTKKKLTIKKESQPEPTISPPPISPPTQTPQAPPPVQSPSQSPPATISPPSQPTTVLTVPSVDINAPLKIESSSSTTIEEAPLERRNKKLFILGIITTVIIFSGTVLFSVFYIQNSSKRKETTLALPTPKEEPKPTQSFDRSRWYLEILNGSGVAGVAAKAAEELQSRGYQIMKIGNADRSDYKNTQIFIAKDLMSQADTLWTDLTSDIQNGTIAGELKDSTFSARIILGRD